MMTTRNRKPSVALQLAVICALLPVALKIHAEPLQSDAPDTARHATATPHLHDTADQPDPTRRNARLGDLLSALSTMTGRSIHVEVPPGMDLVLNESLREWPLDTALDRLLGGFSYLRIDNGSASRVILLTTGRRPDVPDTTPGAGARSPLPATGKGAPATTQANAVADERPVTHDRPDAATIVAQAADLLDNLPPGEDGMVQARMAMETLAVTDDPRAAQVLIHAASPNSPLADRTAAVDALWQVAAELQFEDPTVNAALARLARDRDQGVSWMATKAIRDMETFADED